MTTIYIEIPNNPGRLTALRVAYGALGVRGAGNADEDEKIGEMVVDGTGTRLITGSQDRLTAGKAETLRLGNAPWIKIHTDGWPDDWVYLEVL